MSRAASPLLRGRLTFLATFSGCAVLFGLAFHVWGAAFGVLYLHPVSAAGAWLLRSAGVPVAMDASGAAAGLCVLQLEQVTFHVKHECTGLSALLLFLAAVAAYPAPLAHRLRGVLAGVPAFFAYSATRLLVLGLIARHAPQWLGASHLYLMVLCNLGFMLFVWALWVNRVPTPSGSRR